jgi:transposase-like protein
MHCGRKYTPEPKQHGYPDEVRKQALQLYVDGMNLRRIGRHLGLHHRTVSLWVKASVANLPETPVPEEVKIAEMDELFTFIGNKKQDLHHHDRRPANALLFELQSCLGAHATRYSGDG